MSEPFIAEIRIFAGNFAPRSWAFCNGQLLPIAQNTALFSLIVAAIAMAWIKMESAATFVTVGFAFTLTAIAITVLNIFCAIGKRRLVTGTAQFVTPDGYLDLATLQPQVANARVLSKYEDAPPEETM